MHLVSISTAGAVKGVFKFSRLHSKKINQRSQKNVVLVYNCIYMTYSETCVLWTPWDQQKVSILSRCSDFSRSFFMKKCYLGPQPSVWIMQVSLFQVFTLTGSTVFLTILIYNILQILTHYTPKSTRKPV